MSAIVIPVTALCLLAWWNKTPALKMGRKSFTFYHMNSCPHCKHMYPEMRRFGCRYKDIDIRWVEEHYNKELDVRAFPTLIYRNSRGEIEKYTGPRNYNSIKQYLELK